jgi:hypothetical protein
MLGRCVVGAAWDDPAVAEDVVVDDPGVLTPTDGK